MKSITASKLGLLNHCRYVARDEAVWDNTSSAAADRGTRFHRAIAEYVNGGPIREPDADFAVEYSAAVAWVERYGIHRLDAEVAFGWDPHVDTAFVVATKGERGYPKGSTLIFGTADLVSIDEQGIGRVWDWKTGDTSNAGPQLRALGLFFARAHGLRRVVVSALRVDATGVTEEQREELDEFALACIAGENEENLAAVEGAEPVPGPHCGDLYCPARTTCPAMHAAMAELVPADALVKHRFETTIRSPEHAVWMLDRIRLVESAAKAAKDAIKAVVPADGWVLTDGSVLRESTRNMPRFDKARAIALLKELGANDEQIEGLTYTYAESAGLRVIGKAKGRAKGRAA